MHHNETAENPLVAHISDEYFKEACFLLLSFKLRQNARLFQIIMAILKRISSNKYNLSF